ncbi:MAG: type II secretion system protein [Nitrospirota bacterium]
MSRRRPNAPDSGVRGFTLIEVTITILVIAIIGTAVLLPFVSSLSGSPNPVVMQQAIDLAQGELEQVIATKRANGFAAIVSGCSAFPMPAGFTCTRTVCYVPAANLNDTSTCAAATAYKRVAVTVNHALVGDVSAVSLVTNP